MSEHPVSHSTESDPPAWDQTAAADLLVLSIIDGPPQFVRLRSVGPNVPWGRPGVVEFKSADDALAEIGEWLTERFSAGA